MCIRDRYQKLRQEFLDSLTVDMLNQYLRQQLSQDMALVLQQPQGEMCIRDSIPTAR